ncbi:MAG: hypothetical protein M9899_11000 [Bdellovibrionaceae bacterium]|nr:hypothetical protein [Pseudobdellovibrionaceae bacterium]
MGAEKIKEDVLSIDSKRKGVGGVLEKVLRRFRTLSFSLLLLPVIFICVFCVGVAAGPGLYVFFTVQEFTAHWAPILKYMAMGIGLAAGYFIYGISLVFVVPLVNFLIPFKVKAFRGPWFSLPTIPWFIHNALTYMVRFTFLEFITPSPLNVLFFKMMGMKIGKGVVINTSNISDPCMITLGDYVTIGGSATIFAHSGQKGFLIIEPVTIGDHTNIGLKASIMGGAKIGNRVTIKPHSVVLPKHKIEDGQII